MSSTGTGTRSGSTPGSYPCRRLFANGRRRKWPRCVPLARAPACTRVYETRVHAEWGIVYAMDTTPTSLAYAAGIMDGEGSIKPQKPRQSLICGFTNTDKNLIDWFVKRYGGRVWEAKANPDRNKVACYQWGLITKPALEFIPLIIPYLVVKKEIAQFTIDSYRPAPTDCSKCGGPMDEVTPGCSRCRARHHGRRIRASA